MNLAEWINTYGYLAVAVGTFLEGETVLLLAGLAVHQGYLGLPQVILVAAAASLLGDQLYFGLGHWRGRRLLARLRSLQRATKRLRWQVRRHQNLLILSIRFLYGLRIAGPIVIGMSGVAWPRFLFFNLLGAALWAPLIAGLGYLLGEALQRVLVDLHRYEAGVFLGILLLAGAWHLVRALRARSVRATVPADQRTER
jgi:membrane protein DedA with SNARE-associated domain